MGGASDEHPEGLSELRASGGIFDFKDGPPFALAYLKTYYDQPPTADETAVYEFLVDEFRRRPPAGRFLELGCGPTVHHVLPFAPHVSEIHMADYLEENLEQVRAWRERAPGAHDWSAYTGLALDREGGKVSPAAIAEREQLVRDKLTRLMSCDLMQATPEESAGQYDAVGCFYCAEEVGISLESWRAVLGRVTAYLRPGGTLYMSALAEMDGYDVRDATGHVVRYPCARLDGPRVRAALEQLGYRMDTLRVEAQRIEHPDCGVAATLNVAATR